MPKERLFFIRHGQLVEPYDDHLTMDYETLADLSTSRLDPGIRSSAPELFKTQTAGVDFAPLNYIYYNNSGFQSRRSFESAQIIVKEFKDQFGKDISPIGLPELREVRFDVEQLLSREDFSQKGMPAIRTAFYKSIVEGGTSESLSEIEERIRKIHELASKHSKNNESVLFVTHDFFMRVIEVYIKKPDRLEKTTVEDLENSRLNYYLAGFFTDSDFRELERWGTKIPR